MMRCLLAAVWLASTLLPASARGSDVLPDADAELQRLLALPPALQTQLQAYGLARDPQQRRRLQRLLDFVFLPDGLGMRYREGATHTVAESHATREANCLGFTLLFVALAREAGLEAAPQEIRETLSWARRDGTVYRNSHVNAVVRVAGRRYTVDVARDTLVARDPPQPLSERELLAHYYNNLAVDRLASGDAPAAHRLLQRALAFAPARASHWSNVGVVELRLGDAAAAERAYARALALDARNPEALFNSVGLAQKRGDMAAAADYRARLARVQRSDPFHHFLMAIERERAGDYRQAIEHYRRAVRLHRREPRFHAALAQAYALAGERDKAARTFEQARKLAAVEPR